MTPTQTTVKLLNQLPLVAGKEYAIYPPAKYGSQSDPVHAIFMGKAWIPLMCWNGGIRQGQCVERPKLVFAIKPTWRRETSDEWQGVSISATKVWGDWSAFAAILRKRQLESDRIRQSMAVLENRMTAAVKAVGLSLLKPHSWRSDDMVPRVNGPGSKDTPETYYTVISLAELEALATPKRRKSA